MPELKNHDPCPVCGKRKIRVNKSYYEPFVRCSYCKIGAFQAEFKDKYVNQGPPGNRSRAERERDPMDWDKLYYCYAPTLGGDWKTDIWCHIAGVIAEDTKDAETKFAEMNLPVDLNLCIIKKFGEKAPINGEKKI